MHPHDLNDDEIKAKLAFADNLIRAGKIFSAKTRDLEIALLGLCDQRADATHVVKEINKGMLFTSILMARRSRFHNWLVIILAFIAILVGVAQVWFALPPKTFKNSRDEQRTCKKLDANSSHQKDGGPVNTSPKIIIDGIPTPAPK